MAEVFAGFVAGYVLALITTPMVAIGMVRMRANSALLARLLPEGVSATPLAVIVHGGLFFFWTALGLILGLMLLSMKDSGAALGSLNGAFTLFVAGLTLALVAPFAIVLRPAESAMITGGIVVILVFGWLMPYMAHWSNFKEPPPKQRKGPQILWQASAADGPYLVPRSL